MTDKLINPYVAGAPLLGERGFFGRQDTLDWVTRELRNPTTNALVLFGQRRIGKTTLLLIIAFFRELFGMGTFLGISMPFFSGLYWDTWIIMVMPPGAFFMLAVVGGVFRSIQAAQEAKSK